MLAASNTLPDNAGYVAAAYLVFLALLLIYVGIMAYKLIKVQRLVAEINELTDTGAGGDGLPESQQQREETPV